MTQQELDALPEVGGMTFVKTDKGLLPVALDTLALYQNWPDDPRMVTDQDGSRWLIGRRNGQLCKRKLRP